MAGAVSGVALVTGGVRGIGFEVVRPLAPQGMTVILGARDLDSVAAEELSGDGLDVRAGTIDDADGASVRELADWVAGEFGRIDVLVNNAWLLVRATLQPLAAPQEEKASGFRSFS